MACLNAVAPPWYGMPGHEHLGYIEEAAPFHFGARQVNREPASTAFIAT